MPEVSPDFIETLSKVEEAGNSCCCYQCNACVAECPAARYCEGFNPREIVLASLLGVADYLTDKDSIIWQCATCYMCYERCPQGTHPVEVIGALKNIAFALGAAPDDIAALRETVIENGTLVVLSKAIEKRRAELGLPAVRAAAGPAAAEIRKLLE
ncbi:MAG: hypothetical protein CVT63_02120 [Candidatus Anoxymicrobium japonicum]|uniref:4Fe-4S ferredoxin-type domain-containing protein n=1 Tax=Candidatus Anoxymicrobium japonicum TaxID=2013648 RepID=A0A2N3G760_9ACTN|nr:MAG: hypothetical protein CVT63_02120 [Candidatus Anoxymicrobium japonicum]